MDRKQPIYSYDLKHQNIPVPFAIRTMEEIDTLLGGISDLPHRHNYYTVIWPITATGKHIIDFREYKILPDHLFFVSPDQVHQVITDPSPTGFVILFTSEFLHKNSINENLITNLKLFKKSDETPPLPVSDTMKPKILSFVCQMISEFNSPKDLHWEIIGAYLKLFLLECNSHCSLNVDSNTQSAEVGKNIYLKFKQLLDQNFMSWHQVKNYADELYVTPNYLNEIINIHLHISAKEFIQNKIILEAKRLIVFSDKNMKEIGYSLGFNDPSHFSKFFRSNTGLSVAEFKKSVSK